MYERNIFCYLLCIIIAGLFHNSAFLLLPFYFLRKVFLKFGFYLPSLVIAFLISIFGIDGILRKVLPYISIYAHYLTGEGYGAGNIALVSKLTKYIFIPFYLLSVKSRKRLIDFKDIFFYNMGFFAFCIKILALSSLLLNRFAAYFELLTIFPMYYLLIYLFQGGKKSIYREERILFLFGLFAMSTSLFCIKVLFSPTNEYSYASVFSRYFN
jgi:hypothetical protein